MKIQAVTAFADNIIWMLHEPEQPEQGAWAVDPGDAAPVQNWLTEQGLTLTGVLITHHHQDHVGGLEDLKAAWFGLPVWGPDACRVHGVTQVVGEGDRIPLWRARAEPDAHTHAQVLAVPGHTQDHLAFWLPEQQALFCGDTLFGAGCGRLLGGSAEDLFASLQRLARLPAETRVYCAHEYTLSNLRFAAAAEPDNPAIPARQARDQASQAAGRLTLPSTLADEALTNPFLRADGLEAFRALRSWKDRF